MHLICVSQSTQKCTVQFISRTDRDVPVWLEVMNRTTRTKQLVYAVRVKETVLTQNNDPDLDDSERSVSTYVKLRTGRDLAPIMRLGVRAKPDELSPTPDQWQQR